MTERLTGMKRAKRDGDVKKFRMAHGEANERTLFRKLKVKRTRQLISVTMYFNCHIIICNFINALFEEYSVSG